MKIVFELPFYDRYSGGIFNTIMLAEKLAVQHEVEVRFQREIPNREPSIQVRYSYGMPDETFPACDVCITYSDTPYIDQLMELQQVKRKMIYMMSYGMAIERERSNILTKGLHILCTSKKIELAIHEHGVKVDRIGFNIDIRGEYDQTFYEMIAKNVRILQRGNIAVIYSHTSRDKMTALAHQVATELKRQNRIDNIISFGNTIPKLPVLHHSQNASLLEVIIIFSLAKLFIMPSVTEGLNRTPIESTLCGCPAVISNGAIGEIFMNGENCMVAKKGDYQDILNKSIEILEGQTLTSTLYQRSMQLITQDYTWDNLINNLNNIL